MMFLKSLAKAMFLASLFRRDARGATAIEYSLLAAGLSMAAAPVAPIVKAKAADLGAKFEHAFTGDYAVMKKKREWFVAQPEASKAPANEAPAIATPAKRRWFR